MSKDKPASFSPYFRTEDADQVRAVFEAVGAAEGHRSISELIEAATLRELKRLQRKYNAGKSWPGVPASQSRAGRPRTKTRPTPERPNDDQPLP